MVNPCPIVVWSMIQGHSSGSHNSCAVARVTYAGQVAGCAARRDSIVANNGDESKTTADSERTSSPSFANQTMMYTIANIAIMRMVVTQGFVATLSRR